MRNSCPFLMDEAGLDGRPGTQVALAEPQNGGLAEAPIKVAKTKSDEKDGRDRIKPDQGQIKANQTKSNQIKPEGADHAGAAKRRKMRISCYICGTCDVFGGYSTGFAGLKLMLPNQTQSNPVKPAEGEKCPEMGHTEGWLVVGGEWSAVRPSQTQSNLLAHGAGVYIARNRS